VRAWRIITLALAVSAAAPAEAQTYKSCYEPEPPRCINSYGTFDDEWAFESCKAEVKRYIAEVETFQSCLADWHEAVGYEVDKVIERFNCKARGEVYCP